MQFARFSRFVDTEKKVLWLIFTFFTIISALQYAQYFIAYNNSYPFPWKYNLSITFGTFYSYFLFVPLAFRMAAILGQRVMKLWALITCHLLLALLISLAHLMIVQLIEWAQVYQWTETPFFTAYRWKLASWIHFEVLIYGVLMAIWHGLQYLKWQKAASKTGTAEPEKGPEYLTRVKVKEGGQIQFISIDEVRWLEAYDNYVKLYVNGRFYLLRKTLGGLEKQLDPARFQRIHRSYLVALEEVEKIRTSGGSYEVTLKQGETLKLSRTYKAVLEGRLAGK